MFSESATLISTFPPGSESPPPILSLSLLLVRYTLVLPEFLVNPASVTFEVIVIWPLDAEATEIELPTPTMYGSPASVT